MDGTGRGLAARRTTADDLPSIPGTPGDLEPDTEDNSIQRHVDNLWALGGEFIRDLHYDPPQRKKPVKQVLLKMIEYGGPLLYHGGEAEQNSFDATCRKLKRFLDETAS